jgi:hypothetical protein
VGRDTSNWMPFLAGGLVGRGLVGLAFAFGHLAYGPSACTTVGNVKYLPRFGAIMLSSPLAHADYRCVAPWPRPLAARSADPAWAHCISKHEFGPARGVL